MIRNFKHKGLKQFFEAGKVSAIQPRHTARLRMQLASLHTAHEIDDLDIPGYYLHKLQGKHKNRWSIRVNKNWRLTFEFIDGDVFVLDYEDYH